MKFFLLFFFVFYSIITQSQTPNGKFDDIRNLSTRYTVQIPMSDGINLSTDIFLPITSDSLVFDVDIDGDIVPVEFIKKGTQLLIYPYLINDMGDTIPNPNPYQLPLIYTRTPYNKQGGGGGEVFAVLGYAFAFQDMRGRYESQGAYIPMYPDGWKKTPYISTQHVLDVTPPASPQNANKHQDGWDSYQYFLNDALRDFDLTGDGVTDTTALFHNGTIGMFGASALGNTQYQLAAANYICPDSPGLKGLLPIVATNEHYNSTAYNNGVFRRMLVYGWVSNQLSNLDESLMPIDTTLFNSIHTPADYNLPNTETVINLAVDHFSSLKYGQNVSSFYPNSVLRGSMDASFAPVNQYGIGDSLGTFSRYTNMNVPAYHLTGWYDIFIDGQIKTFQKMRDNVSGPAAELQKLVIGPWAHQTIGSETTGDMTYKENVGDVIGTTWDDINQYNFEAVINSEFYSWFRDRLNYNGYRKTTDPVFRVPESDWQDIPNNRQIKVPAYDYDIPFITFINYITGAGPLPKIPVMINTGSGTTTVYMDVPPLDNPPVSGSPITEIPPVDYKAVPDVRFYVIGPVDDGITANEEVGNYWFATDNFPLHPAKINYQAFYMHQNGTLDTLKPTAPEGYKMYINNPDDITQGWSIGGNNMIVRTPQNDRNSQGQFNLAAPQYAPYALNNPSIISFTTMPFQDTMSFIGFPKATIYAKAETLDQTQGPTDCDFFVRILDVYPDGRELFVTEGAVSARARHYARSLYEGQEDINAPISNIQLGQIYEFSFNLLPIAYTLGKGHSLKILIQSKNYPRYQSNPQIPIEDGDFFRREPNDGQTYMYQGTEYHPRTLSFSVAFAPDKPSHISLPLYNGSLASTEEITGVAAKKKSPQVFPNPAQDILTILTHGKGKAGYALYNSMGQKVKKGSFETAAANLNVNHLPTGIYIITILQDNNLFTKKIIIN